MLALFQAFFQIVMRRRGPEDLPDSTFLLGIALAAYVAAQVPVAAVIYGWSPAAAQAIAIDVLLLALTFWLLLKFTRNLSRYRRTLTALAGTGALLAVPQAPLVLFSRLASAAGQPPIGATAGLLALLFWSIMVQAHIASRALSVGFGVGLAIALGYFILSFQVSAQFAPAAG